ncbi:Papain family cysteine protease [Actinidia rufa]|uniref:Papain family cysteine protease n=1 Tax=Actinidia rufa TaxID=165716 RepID=A0A7J0D920_9ERIC|nr:Papain family cysteine protease [Actinidia rufa]
MAGVILPYVVCIAALTCALVHVSPQDPNILQITDNHRLLGTATELRFRSFMKEYGKEYSTREEYVRRLGVFAGNLEAVWAQLGVAAGAAEEMEVRGLPESFDWRGIGAVTEVKMQCDPTDRTACNNGCLGGLMTNAYKYLIEAGGIEEEDSYPYTGKQGDCKSSPDKAAVKVVNFTNVPIDEQQIAAHLVHHGPLAVGLNAVFMQTYIGGVSCPLICGKRWVNHGVLLVGYGSKGYSILRLGYQPYWIIKNSWGKRWGRARILSTMQGPWHVRNEHDGLLCHDSNIVKRFSAGRFSSTG